MYISFCFVKRIGIYIALCFLQSFCVVTDQFVDGHLYKFTHCSNENVVADNMFVEDHFQKLRLPDLTMFSIGSAKNKAKGFDLEFDALVGCPDKSMKHEINKLRNFRRINQRVKVLKNCNWDKVIEIDSFVIARDLRKCFDAMKNGVVSRDLVSETLLLMPPTVVCGLVLLYNNENGTKDVELISQMLDLFKQVNVSMELKHRFLLSNK
ncbi:hypothetical protein Hanom_Chr01g00037921 [Helianthus anomalus]